MEKRYLKGNMIEPLDVTGNDTVKDFFDNVFGFSGYNARKLADAGVLFNRMIENDATICLTLAGAMTPVGMSGPIIALIEKGFVDFIISTGANIYHDLHRAYNKPMVQGDAHVDDEKLYKEGISRIYDIFIDDELTMFPTDKCIVNSALQTDENELKKTFTTSRLHKIIGDYVLKTALNPEKSFLAMASKYNVPIYTSSPGDSSIAMNLAVPYVFGHKIIIDPIADVIETTAIVRKSKKNGVIIVGGGSPKNFYMQTQPTLWQIFRDESRGGHDYFIQLTTDSPQWGGLSGATPQEAKSWGKVKNAEKNSVVVYSCASITFPLLAKYVLASNKPKKRKDLGIQLPALIQEFINIQMKNKEFLESLKSNIKPDQYKKLMDNMHSE